MPPYREGPPPRAVARANRVHRRDNARIQAAVRAGAFKAPARQAGRQFHAAPAVRRSTIAVKKPQFTADQRNAIDLKRGSAITGGALKKARAVENVKENFRGIPGTLDLGSFPYTDPKVAAMARFQGYAARLWPRVKQKYGLPADAKMPPLKVMSNRNIFNEFGEVDPEKYLAAVTVDTKAPPSRRVVKVTPAVIAASSSRTNRTSQADRDFAHAILLHEWTHANQRVRLSDKLAEGGAQAMTEDLAPTVHTHAPKGATPYDAEVKAARRKGARFIHDTQLKKPKVLPAPAVRFIDDLRRRGHTYDTVAGEIARRGLPAWVLEAYGAVTDEHGRRRDGVNPADPGDPVWGGG